MEGAAHRRPTDDRQAADRRAGGLRRWRSSTRTRTSSGRSTSKNIPDPQLRILETPVRRLAEEEVRLARRGVRGVGAARTTARDDPAEGRVAFRPLWNIANERTPRDQDTARFLLESQRGFYDETYKFLRVARLQGADHRVELDHRQPGGPRPAGEVQLHRRRLHRPPRLLRLPAPRARTPSGRSATATPTPTAAPCGSTPSSRASRKAVRPPGDGPAATTASRR